MHIFYSLAIKKIISFEFAVDFWNSIEPAHILETREVFSPFFVGSRGGDRNVVKPAPLSNLDSQTVDCMYYPLHHNL